MSKSIVCIRVCTGRKVFFLVSAIDFIYVFKCLRSIKHFFVDSQIFQLMKLKLM